MDKQQISHLLHIQKASRENRLAIFVGAGVSRNSGIPTWNELIESMKAELPEKLTNEMDALKVAQLYKDSRGHKEYMDKVKEVLLYNKAVPNRLHKSILLLNPCHIITTNYDDLIEQELINQFTQYDIVREDKDIPQIVYPNVLVKMHGDYTTDNIVLTETDYYNYSKNFPLIRAFVQSVFASKLVLFVGFSFADLNLKMILNELQNILSENMQRAYLLSCEEPDFVTKQYFEKKGINILYFSEKDIDVINGKEYNLDDLNGIGRLTDKILYAINNYREVPKQDLAAYLYDRVMSYSQELRSFGDGLRYFFPNYKKMTWNAHSNGLQTNLKYFKDLESQVIDNRGKRRFLINHPSISLKALLQLAWYNYLEEIDNIKILDDKFYQNINYYIPKTTIYYIRNFDYIQVCNKLKELRCKTIKHTIDDLELPFTLYLLGDYWEAFKIYKELLSRYWNRKKYILYFICRYNMWAIRNCIWAQKIFDKSFNIKKALESVNENELEEILNKLPLNKEIKKIFQDLVSYRAIGNNLVKTEDLKERIFQQRKSQEKGGCSVNSNIVVLMSIYQRERIFSWANCIICDNSLHYKSLCHNTALGILNSFATPPSKMYGIGFEGTRIESLDNFMLRMLIFDNENEKLKSILNGYDIKTLLFDESGINYINTCLNNIVQENQYLFKNDSLFYNPLSNLLLIISRSHNDGIDVEALYRVLLKCWRFENYIGNQTIHLLISQYPPKVEIAKELIELMLYNSNRTFLYNNCLYSLIEILKDKKIEFTDIRTNELFVDNNRTLTLCLLYPIITEPFKGIVLDYCLNTIDNLYHYLFLIFNNNIHSYSIERFNKLLNKGKITMDCCYLLAQMRKDNSFSELHDSINKVAISNDCLQFFIDPYNYSSLEKVEISWILKLDEKERISLLKNEIYREKLKEYIKTTRLSEDNRNYLISLL